jgi:hypothetical protein
VGIIVYLIILFFVGLFVGALRALAQRRVATPAAGSLRAWASFST